MTRAWPFSKKYIEGNTKRIEMIPNRKQTSQGTKDYTTSTMKERKRLSQSELQWNWPVSRNRDQIRSVGVSSFSLLQQTIHWTKRSSNKRREMRKTPQISSLIDPYQFHSPLLSYQEGILVQLLSSIDAAEGVWKSRSVIPFVILSSSLKRMGRCVKRGNQIQGETATKGNLVPLTLWSGVSSTIPGNNETTQKTRKVLRALCSDYCMFPIAEEMLYSLGYLYKGYTLVYYKVLFNRWRILVVYVSGSFRNDWKYKLIDEN